MALVLPKYVTFKGDNDKYLKRYSDGKHQYCQFSAEEIGDRFAAWEIFPTSDGNIRIKSADEWQKFWRVRHDDWVGPDSDDTSSDDRATLFRPLQVDDNTIALINVGNNRICKRLTARGKTSCFSAGTNTVESFAKLKVEEPVLRRQIYDIKYDFDNAKIYGETVRAVGQDFLSNHTNQTVSMYSEIKYEDIQTTTWKSSFSLKSSVTATAQAGIPKIAEAKVVATQEIQAGVEWGKTETKKTEKRAGTTISVPPKSKATINLIGKQGKCDVSFTYKQKDTLYDGSTVITECHGTFNGSNMYSTTFDVPKFEPL